MSSTQTSEYFRSYYLKNRDRILRRTRRYHLQHLDKFKKYRRAYYKKNKGSILRKLSERYFSQRQQIDNFKCVPCVDCRVSYPSYVMDFDHVRGVKKGSVADMCSEHRPLAEILKEIQKCDVVCANCHRKRTHSANYNKRKGGSKVAVVSTRGKK